MVQLALMVLQTIHALVLEALLAETVRQILMIANHPLVNTMELVWIELMNTVAHVLQDSLGRIVRWNLMNVTVTLVCMVEHAEILSMDLNVLVLKAQMVRKRSTASL